MSQSVIEETADGKDPLGLCLERGIGIVYELD